MYRVADRLVNIYPVGYVRKAHTVAVMRRPVGGGRLLCTVKRELQSPRCIGVNLAGTVVKPNLAQSIMFSSC